MHTPSLVWRLKSFAELPSRELYEILHLRTAVFVVEQNCPYLEVDRLDYEALHLSGFDDGQLLTYARLFAPSPQQAHATIGRVVVAIEARKQGLGHLLMRKAIDCVEEHWGRVPIKISAQCYLRDFYQSHGFEPISEEYLLDNIPHIDMRRLPASN
ncbi:GNAT family N-acetyltransferase [Eisenibacter elegans]|jgi:ElaA protein|uniref:GNAT family N-acetyltransferase n=1 Tax=Eisenibacter elegans TaxID=997 RepID=UPI00040F42AE|nr:GNAT family N-acetyltransferase [Eisenibacter elegans]